MAAAVIKTLYNLPPDSSVEEITEKLASRSYSKADLEGARLQLACQLKPNASLPKRKGETSSSVIDDVVALLQFSRGKGPRPALLSETDTPGSTPKKQYWLRSSSSQEASSTPDASAAGEPTATEISPPPDTPSAVVEVVIPATPSSNVAEVNDEGELCLVVFALRRLTLSAITKP